METAGAGAERPAETEGTSWRHRAEETASCSEDRDKLSEEDREDTKLSLITWNVDGLDGEEQPERARGLCSELTRFSPDVVFLQELVQPYVRFLHKRLSDVYTYIEGGKVGYFTGMLLKKSRVTLLKTRIIDYPASRMLRNLLIAQVMFRGQKLWLMTSHFESCKANVEERLRQMQLVMKGMSKAPEDISVLFGGDTNLRDAEVAKVGLPSNVCDVWEELRRPWFSRYTWDMKYNDNLDISFPVQFRFDRVYLRRATVDGAPHLKPDSISLVGQERLKCGPFISDHWGIYCTFSTLETHGLKPAVSEQHAPESN